MIEAQTVVQTSDATDAKARSAHLVVTPHPLTTQGQVSVAVLMRDGETLLQVLERHGVTDTWVVEVGGLKVPALMWGRVRVHHGQVIECRSLVQKDLIKIIAFAALAFVTMGAGNAWLSAATGLSGVGLAVAGAVVFAGGAMIINKLLPPPSSGSMRVANNAEPTYSLSGGRNQARLWEPMSLVLGQPYVVPDLAGQPWTYFGGEDQYLVQQFHAGLNCYCVESLCVGQTPVSSYQGVAISAVGLPGNSYAANLPNNSVDSIAGALLDCPDSTNAGPWVQRTTSINTVMIGIDLECSIFGLSSSTGAYEARTVQLDVQYAVVGTEAWTAWPPRPGDSPSSVTLSNASSKPLRVQLSLQVTSGQYDIRVRKKTANETVTNAQNAVTWTVLKSFQQDLTSYPGQGIVALTIKASGQLNGAIDNLNWLATAAPMPWWSGGTWATATNRENGLSNPGAQILLLARGIFDENGKLIAGLGWDDSRIDVDGLKRFMVWCRLKDLTFDAVIQSAISTADLLEAIAYAGLGTISWAEGRLGVQWLDNTAPIEGVINMGNIKTHSFSVAYDGNDRSDEIEYGYFERAQKNQWNSLRVTAPGVTLPRTTARLSNMGITTEAHAALLARHAMAQNIYMAKSIVFEQDLEYMTYRRGTVLALSHDMTQWGYSGRVKSAVLTAGVATLTLDDTIPATGPEGVSSRYIGLRLVGETQYRVFTIMPFTGTTRTVNFEAWPNGVALPGTNGQPMDALWIYDFKPTPGLKVVVAKIEPSDNQSGARVTVVPLPDEFWPYVLNGTYTAAPNRTLLSSIPKVSNASISSTPVTIGSTAFADLVLSFDVDGPFEYAVIYGSINGQTEQILGSLKGRNFAWRSNPGVLWNLRIVPFSSIGNMGSSVAISYDVEAAAAQINSIGSPGALGFGVGVAPQIPVGFTALQGTTDQASPNYGNYRYSDGSIMVYIPAFYYKYGTGFNGLQVNVVDIKAYIEFSDVATANAAGYAMHRAFYNAGSICLGFFIDKYMCSNNAGIASSIQNANPLLCETWPAPFSGLTGSPANEFWGAIDAAKTRGPRFFCNSRFIHSALALLANAHASASSNTTYCAWYMPAANFPKGNNNGVLNDFNDPSISYVSFVFGVGKTGSANLPSRVSHNGQDCGVMDLNGNVSEINLGITSDSNNYYLLKPSTDISSITSGNTLATDAWGSAGLAAMYDNLGATYESLMVTGTKYFGSAGQVLSAATSGLAWNAACAGIPLASGIGGSNQFGNDYFYENRANQLIALSGGQVSGAGGSGIWSLSLYNRRDYSLNTAGFRSATYL